jgi:hypothetical protein
MSENQVTITNSAPHDITRDPLVNDLLIVKKEGTQHLYAPQVSNRQTLCRQRVEITDQVFCLPMSGGNPICGDCFAFVVAP